MADISLPALAAALAWVDHYTGQRDPRYFHICTLAAAVRELRGENLRLTHESNGRQFRLQQAEAALAEVRGRVCRRCDKWDECGDGDGQGYCAYFGAHVREDFACAAWSHTEGQHD
jgi:hypothetical protein